MKFFMMLGVVVWIFIAIWFIRLGMGLDHLTRDQIPAMLVGGVVGGLAGWYYVSRHARKLADQGADR